MTDRPSAAPWSRRHYGGGEISTGLEQIKGTLGILVERTQRTDADVRPLRADTERENTELRAELEEFKKGRRPLAQIGALAAVAGVVAAVIAIIVS